MSKDSSKANGLSFPTFEAGADSYSPSDKGIYKGSGYESVQSSAERFVRMKDWDTTVDSCTSSCISSCVNRSSAVSGNVYDTPLEESLIRSLPAHPDIGR
jgi:hypothetical protein